jgi:hypothetical protein
MSINRLAIRVAEDVRIALRLNTLQEKIADDDDGIVTH